MAYIGKIDPFDEGVEDWDSFCERVDQYFVANDIADAKKVSAI